MAKDTIHERIIIDLEDTKRSLVPISESLFVDFPERAYNNMVGRFLKTLSMKRSLKDVRIGIRNLHCPDTLVIKDGKDSKSLFSLVVEGDHHDVSNTPIPVTLTKERTPFQLYFRPELIEDCNVIQGRSSTKYPEVYSITGTAYVQNDKGQDLDTQDFIVNIELKELKADVKVELVCQRRLQYKELPSDRIISIGELRVTNAEKYKRSPEINFEGKISFIGPDGQEMSKVKGPDGQLMPRVRFVDSGNDTVAISSMRSDTTEIDGVMEYVPETKKIEIDLNGIPNPINPYDVFSLRIDGKWTYVATPDIPNLIRDVKEIRLMKDTQGTELRISLQGMQLENERGIELPTFEFSPGGAFRDETIVELSNIATDSSRGGCLRIMAPRIVSSIGEEGLRVYGSNGKSVDMSKIVTIEGDFMEEAMEHGFIDVLNGEQNPEKLKIMYNPTEVYIINNGGQYRFSVNSCIEIDYYENSDNRPWNEVERKTFRIILNRPMYILPFPEWLCVDYGSSAIVSLYKGHLLDLNNRRKDIMRQVGVRDKDWDPRTKGNENETEKDTVFISSDLLLNIVTGIDPSSPVSELCGEQTLEQLDYSKTAVCLAPPKRVAMNNYLRTLPCLKLLVGNRYLPENPDYSNYEYYRRDSDDRISSVKVSSSKENGEQNSLASINVLFDEAYKIVFRHYLSQLIPHIDRVNRLVLTYPNSYTPDHLKVLQMIARDTFRYLREGQLQFVSESDAVAAYYMDHWSEYNPGESIDKLENILVFDMGAGTLDLTYLIKTYDNDTKTHRLDIKGKIGISKAGNYLDFVLASIVAEKGGRHTRLLAKIERPEGVNADIIARGRVELKDFVKNQLKPMLNSDNANKVITFNYTAADVKVDITVGEVLEHPDFKLYLKQVTKDVLKSMEKYLGLHMVLDTIILSGRSVRLEPLKESLHKAIKSFETNRSDNVRILDLDINGQQDRQKTAVVEGAVKYAGSYNVETSKVKIHSRRLYASFGVAFRRLGGEMDYVELASHSDMPMTDEHSSKEFPNVTLTDMTHVDEVRLIQTYLPASQTLEALRNGDFEYISEMNTFSLSSFGGQNTLRMSVNVDRHNQVALYVDGRPTTGTTPKGVDLNNVITRRSIWPTTI